MSQSCTYLSVLMDVIQHTVVGKGSFTGNDDVIKGIKLHFIENYWGPENSLLGTAASNLKLIGSLDQPL